MKQCWSGDPSSRPSFPLINEQLSHIFSQYVNANEAESSFLRVDKFTAHSSPLAQLHRSIFQHVCGFLSRADLAALLLTCRDLSASTLEYVQSIESSQTPPRLDISGDKIVIGNIIGTGAHAIVRFADIS
jgi:hypothetical protein